jgi:hypothetical protein
MRPLLIKTFFIVFLPYLCTPRPYGKGIFLAHWPLESGGQRAIINNNTNNPIYVNDTNYCQYYSFPGE